MKLLIFKFRLYTRQSILNINRYPLHPTKLMHIAKLIVIEQD